MRQVSFKEAKTCASSAGAQANQKKQKKTAYLKIDSHKADTNQLGHDGRIQFVNTGRVTNAK